MIGTLAAVAVMAMPFAPELISFRGGEQGAPALRLSARSSGEIDDLLIPARWTDKRTSRSSVIGPNLRSNVAENKNGEGLEGRRYPASTRGGNRIRGESGLGDPHVIRAKATLRKRDRKPKVMMAKAEEHANHLRQTLLVMHSPERNAQGMPLWTLSVWRFTSSDGQTVQEMIVMNSI
jgi:hypothetical protein